MLLPDIDIATKKFATFSTSRKFRYDLIRVWKHEAPVKKMVVIGLNPSTADETQDDPTVRRCINFAKSFGMGGLWMLNLFAFRATDPKKMLAEPHPVGKRNNDFIVYHCTSADLVLAAWGVHGVHRNRDRMVLTLLQQNNLLHKVHCLGITKDGLPKHPLYLANDSALIPYRGRD